MNNTHTLAVQIMEAMDKNGITITFGEAVNIALRMFNDQHKVSNNK